MPIYMKYGNVKGTVTEAGHKDWIELNSLQWGVGRGISTPVGSATERETSAPSVSEITVSKLLDGASPMLVQESLTGKGESCQIDFLQTQKGTLEVYLTLTLTNTMLSGFSFSTGGDRPSESLSLNFTKIEYKYTPRVLDNTAGSPIPVSYDLATAKTG
jgi:type VI secretion system secreted protein Hcp